MKKIFLISTICLLLATMVSGQTINKKDATNILDKAFSCLKNSDMNTFVSMWLLDNSDWPYHIRPFTEQDVINNFNELKIFLDTAIAQNLTFDYVEIEKATTEEMLHSGHYKIKAWFRYNKNYYKGFGFFVVYKDDKWLVRFSPDYSVMTNNK